MKFIADSTLGRLVRWLRIMGYDTVTCRGQIDRNLLRIALEEGRVVLTRKRKMADRQFAGKLLVIQHDQWDEQILELLDALSLNLDSSIFFSRCVLCNGELTVVAKTEALKRVPVYVYEHNPGPFRLCPSCEKIYWPGTHGEDVRKFMRNRIQPRHP